MRSVTFDTGALIALERRERRMSSLFAVLKQEQGIITVPTVVVAQWVRGQYGFRKLLDAMKVEPLGRELAERVGGTLGRIGGSDIVDVVVVASAATRGDVVYTSDVGDLQRIADAAFPDVRILGT